MRKVKVNCTVSYSYEAKLPDDFDVNDDENIIIAVDGQDPVYHVISNVIRTAKLKYEGRIDTVVDDETGEILFEA